MSKENNSATSAAILHSVNSYAVDGFGFNLRIKETYDPAVKEESVNNTAVKQ